MILGLYVSSFSDCLFLKNLSLLIFPNEMWEGVSVGQGVQLRCERETFTGIIKGLLSMTNQEIKANHPSSI